MRRTYASYFLITLFSLVFLAHFGPAFATCTPLTAAECIPGLPCDVCLTPNDPNNPTDGPNVSNPPYGPNAAKHGSSNACDADLMNRIYARSFMESQRQTILSEVLVRKPDSVMEYSCFNQMASLVATVGGQIFTETPQWDNQQVPIMGELDRKDVDSTRPVFVNTYMEDDRLDKPLQNLVLESLSNYYAGQFPHSFAGGALGVNANNRGQFYNGGYNCGFMNQIHFFSKCLNMAEDDPFLTFEWLSENDPRTLPMPWVCNAEEPLIDKKIIELGEDQNHQYAAFDLLNNTYIDRMTFPYDPVTNLVECRNFVPIPTGASVHILSVTFTGNAGNSVASDSEIYEEKICPNPGCYYNPKLSLTSCSY